MRIRFLVSLLLLAAPAIGQDKVIERIKAVVAKSEAEAHLTFLASDEMRGRGTGSPEIAIAANYLAAQLKIMGVRTLPGSTTYFQEVGLQRSFPPTVLTLRLGNDTYAMNDDLALLKGKTFSGKGDIVFVGYGTRDDFAKADIKGKIVVAYAGSSETTPIREASLKDSPEKYALVKELGGLALIEVVAFKEAPWPRIAARYAAPRISLTRDDFNAEETPHVWMTHSATAGLTQLISQKVADGALSIEVRTPARVPGKNVIGWVEGTDPVLKKEYVALSAHYDHVGVMKNSSPDSIYNGARDNAIGTTALLEASRFLTSNPLRRSVLIMALCAEEEGLLGSRWYAQHPLVPLRQTVFDLDCDGAGYNDKTIVNLVDLNRTTMDDLLKKACGTFGLTLTGDPAPEMNLYERSDNYNFAVKGVPAVDFAPGIKGLNEEVMKYYHQPADESQSLDFDYLEKFFRAYVYGAVMIGNSPARPAWKPGDKFEQAGKKLYGNP